MKQLISIVAPMYNEQDLVEAYCKEMFETLHILSDKYDFEMLLINDGSKDKTFDIICNMQKLFPNEITVIDLSRNFGLEGAVNAGLKKAKGDAVVVMDADLQDPPIVVLDMIKKWEKGFDVITASRITRRYDNFFKRITASMFYSTMDILAGKLKLEKHAANFRLLSRNALETLLTFPETNSIFRVIVPFIGLKTDTVEYERDKRFAGKTKYNFKSMVRYALDSLTSISIEPLRKIAWTIPITLFFMLIFIIGIFFSYNLWRVGFAIMLVMSMFFQILFICIALIGEYIAQIMTEVKRRPISIINCYVPCKNIEIRRKHELHTDG